jgi:hypothetical protein
MDKTATAIFHETLRVAQQLQDSMNFADSLKMPDLLSTPDRKYISAPK